MKRIIISDLHIGSKYANEESLLQFLNNLDCGELILAGDIIDFIKIPTFTEQSHALFKIIENFDGKVIYIVGNHDISFQKLAGKEAFGISFLNHCDSIVFIFYPEAIFYFFILNYLIVFDVFLNII